jgi:hypothetical protein
LLLQTVFFLSAISHVNIIFGIEMVKFSTTILQFAEQGEKTGWSYIKIASNIAQQIKPNTKKSFRVKGKLDNYSFEGIALVPMGGGDFIMALKAELRKKIKKNKGAKLDVQIEEDTKKFTVHKDLLECLKDEPTAFSYFNKLAPSHKKYYSNWIETAKSETTKAKRIALTVTACSRQMHYGEMVRAMKEEKDKLGR